MNNMDTQAALRYHDGTKHPDGYLMDSRHVWDQANTPLLLKSYIGEYSAHWGLFAAGAVLTSLPVMALFYFLQRYLVGGLTAGSVKG